MIDLNSLNFDQLRELNSKIVDRMRYLQQLKAKNLMNTLEYGDEVYFYDKNQNMVRGKVIRFNQKSVTIKEEQGMEWRVSPSFVKKSPIGVINQINH